MEKIIILQNLDLLSLGITTAAILILAVAIYSTNKKSITNRSFLLFSIITVVWGVLNYLAHESTDQVSLILFRVVIFLGVWHAYSAFQLFYVFPREKVKFNRLYKAFLLPVVTITSILTLTPIVFKEFVESTITGKITKIENGPGIAIFGIVVLALVIAGIFNLLKKTLKATGVEKKQFRTVLFGTSITFSLLMLFNFILPAFFERTQYISLGALFIFPFIAFTYYSIARHKLLKIKVIASELLIFTLSIVSFFEVIFASEFSIILFRVGLLLLILGIGIILIRSVRKEVQQREELEKLSQQLAYTNEELEKLNEQKSQFLSFASHDLKSPLALIKQFATLINDGTYNTPDKIKETTTKIKDHADRAVVMVDNFLDLRKIEEGKMEYDFQPVNIVSFVKEAVENFSLIAENKNIDVSFYSNSTELVSKIDTDKMSQVIQNLLSNSLKYTEKGSIAVNMKDEQKSILITVKDTGIGMSGDTLASLFEQFNRAKNVKKTIKGTGLGLYISKQIVLAHHGEIWVESEGEGKGSSFFVRLRK